MNLTPNNFSYVTAYNSELDSDLRHDIRARDTDRRTRRKKR